MRNLLRHPLGICAIGLMAVACSPALPKTSSVASPTPSAQIENSATPVRATSTASVQPQLATPKPTSIPTPTPMHSPTLTPLPTETPMPALPSEEAKRRVEELLTDNANCQLPCWWGIVPGKTSWSAAQSFLYQFNQAVYVYITPVPAQGSFTIPVPMPVRDEISPTGYVEQYYHIEAGKVQLIEAYAGGRTPFYPLSTVFANYGKPDEIWVWAEPDLPSGDAGVEFAVFYQQLGFIVLNFQLGQQFDTHITVCPPPFSANTLILGEPSIRSDFQSVIKQTNFKAKKYHPLEEVTQVSVDQFFEDLSDPDGELCPDIPIDIWY